MEIFKKWARSRRELYQKSKIAAKLAKKMFLYYSFIYAAVFIVILSLLLPRLFEFSFRKAEETAGLIKREFSDLQSTMLGYADFLYASPQMNALLKSYMQSPTADNASLLQLNMHTYLASQSSIIFLAVEAPNDAFLHTFNYSDNDVPGFLKSNPGYAALKETGTNHYYSPVIHSYFDLNQGEAAETNLPVIFLSKKYYINSDMFIFTLFYDLRSAIRRNATLAENVIDDYVVMDGMKQAIYKNEEIPFSDWLQRLPIAQNKTHGTITQADGIFFYDRITSTNWIVISHASYGTLFSNILLIIIFVVILYLIPPLLFLLWVMPGSIRSLAPLKQLSNTMASFSIGKNITCDIHTGDEIEELSGVFNMMVGKINQQLNNIMAEEKRHSDTKYKLLVTQIDPHFIYNTMNIINILARQQNYSAIIEINSALTRILRERLGTKSSIFDTVEKEISTLKQYITIMNYRYKNNVKVHFDVENGLWEEKIPKNLLQPLVENSYYYGMLNEEGVMDGNIRILIYSQGSEIIIEVSDDGNGIESDKLKKLSSGNFDIHRDGRVHIGLENIQQRLEYIYRDPNCMEIKSRPGHGTTVILTLSPGREGR